MKYLIILALLNACASIQCVEYSEASDMGICKNETLKYDWGSETYVSCEVKARNGKMVYSNTPFLTGQRVCTEYQGQ